jgi:hypothetical protein
MLLLVWMKLRQLWKAALKTNLLNSNNLMKGVIKYENIS